MLLVFPFVIFAPSSISLKLRTEPFLMVSVANGLVHKRSQLQVAIKYWLNIDVIKQSAYLAVDIFRFYLFAYLFSNTPVDCGSDCMMVMALVLFI